MASRQRLALGCFLLPPRRLPAPLSAQGRERASEREKTLKLRLGVASGRLQHELPSPPLQATPRPAPTQASRSREEAPSWNARGEDRGRALSTLKGSRRQIRPRPTNSNL